MAITLITRRKLVQHALKRALDATGSVFGLIVLSPVLIASAIAISATMGSPIFFRQRRPGRDGHIFIINKFRTMRPADDGETWFRTDEERLSRVGRFLRRTSIDELPELWNVLIGDMSLVGPRPLLVEYLDKYTQAENRRHEVRPGITGWAQVNGRQLLPFSERLRLDVWYVDNWSLFLDFRILMRTISGVFTGGGVVSGQNVDIVDDLGLSADRPRVIKRNDEGSR